MLEKYKHQHETHVIGKNFHNAVVNDLRTNGYKILNQNKHLKDIGIEIDIIAEKNNIIEYIEAKGGKKRVDQLKRGLFNALIFSESHYCNEKNVFILYTENEWKNNIHIKNWIYKGRLKEHRTSEIKDKSNLNWCFK